MLIEYLHQNRIKRSNDANNSLTHIRFCKGFGDLDWIGVSPNGSKIYYKNINYRTVSTEYFWTVLWFEQLESAFASYMWLDPSGWCRGSETVRFPWYNIRIWNVRVPINHAHGVELFHERSWKGEQRRACLVNVCSFERIITNKLSWSPADLLRLCGTLAATPIIPAFDRQFHTELSGTY